MTQALLGSRKRVRNNNCDEECCDFMPLSKRINNLHINNGSCCNGLGHPHPKHPISKQDDPFEARLEDVTRLPLHGIESLQLAFGSDGERNELEERSCLPVNAPSHHYGGENGGALTPAHAHAWMTDQIMSQYSPDLTASDNPYYYENNKLLFALYMERVQRGGQELY